MKCHEIICDRKIRNKLKVFNKIGTLLLNRLSVMDSSLIRPVLVLSLIRITRVTREGSTITATAPLKTTGFANFCRIWSEIILQTSFNQMKRKAR